jgi:hypothetical protein
MRTRGMMVRWCGMTAVAFVITGVGQASGGEAETRAHDGWRFQVVPYLWLPSVHGDEDIGDFGADLDVGDGDVFESLFDGDVLGGMAHFEARHGKVSLFLDAMGATVRSDEDGTIARRPVDVRASLDFVAVELGAAYRVVEVERHTFSTDVLAGGRYNHVFGEIEGEGEEVERSRDASADFVDPFIGARFAVGLIDELSFGVRGDVGGFGAGSDLAWTLVGTLRYRLPWTLAGTEMSVIAGYKVYDLDYTAGARGRERTFDLQARGPIFGWAFSF